MCIFYANFGSNHLQPLTNWSGKHIFPNNSINKFLFILFPYTTPIQLSFIPYFFTLVIWLFHSLTTTVTVNHAAIFSPGKPQQALNCVYFGGLQKYQKLPTEAGTKKKSIPTPVLQFSNFQNAFCMLFNPP